MINRGTNSFEGTTMKGVDFIGIIVLFNYIFYRLSSCMLWINHTFYLWASTVL